MKMPVGLMTHALLSAALMSPAVHAQGKPDSGKGNYPEKPIRNVIPQAAGGNTDLIGRMISEHLNQAWNVPVVVDNRGGAGGNIANELVAKSVPDGYTLLTASPALVTSPALYSKLSYDATKDFAPVAIIAIVPQVLAVHTSVPARSVKELLDLARDKPGSLNYAAPGAGSGPHVAGALFVAMAKVKIEHIAYKGTGPALTDLLAGQVQMQFGGLPALMPHIKGGRIRALGISTARRSPSLPDLPTIAESGVPGFDTAGWVGLAAPAATPPAIVNALAAQVAAFHKRPETIKRFAEQGAEFVESSPKHFQAFILREVPQWKKVLKPLE